MAGEGIIPQQKLKWLQDTVTEEDWNSVWTEPFESFKEKGKIKIYFVRTHLKQQLEDLVEFLYPEAGLPNNELRKLVALAFAWEHCGRAEQDHEGHKINWDAYKSQVTVWSRKKPRDDMDVKKEDVKKMKTVHPSGQSTPRPSGRRTPQMELKAKSGQPNEFSVCNCSFNISLIDEEVKKLETELDNCQTDLAKIISKIEVDNNSLAREQVMIDIAKKEVSRLQNELSALNDKADKTDEDLTQIADLKHKISGELYFCSKLEACLPKVSVEAVDEREKKQRLKASLEFRLQESRVCLEAARQLMHQDTSGISIMTMKSRLPGFMENSCAACGLVFNPQYTLSMKLPCEHAYHLACCMLLYEKKACFRCLKEVPRDLFVELGLEVGAEDGAEVATSSGFGAGTSSAFASPYKQSASSPQFVAESPLVPDYTLAAVASPKPVTKAVASPSPVTTAVEALKKIAKEKPKKRVKRALVVDSTDEEEEPEQTASAVVSTIKSRLRSRTAGESSRVDEVVDLDEEAGGADHIATKAADKGKNVEEEEEQVQAPAVEKKKKGRPPKKMPTQPAKDPLEKKKLVILDLNGVLVSTFQKRTRIKIQTELKKHYAGGKVVVCRPGLIKFLEGCFARFEVAIWSSMMKHNIIEILNVIVPPSFIGRFKFIWGQKECEVMPFNFPGNPNKPVLMKPIVKVYEAFEDVGELVLVDDSLYKTFLSPQDTCFIIEKFDNDINDKGFNFLAAFLQTWLHAKNPQKWLHEQYVEDKVQEEDIDILRLLADHLSELARWKVAILKSIQLMKEIVKNLEVAVPEEAIEVTTAASTHNKNDSNIETDKQQVHMEHVLEKIETEVQVGSQEMSKLQGFIDDISINILMQAGDKVHEDNNNNPAGNNTDFVNEQDEEPAREDKTQDTTLIADTGTSNDAATGILTEVE